VKVLFASGIYPPDIGGPATYVRNLALALRARGIEPEVVTYGDEAPPDDGFPVRSVRRSRGPLGRYADYARVVRRAAARADLVYVQDALSSGLPGSAGAWAARRPVVLKVVGDPAWEVSTEAGWVRDGFGEFQARRYGPRVEGLRRVQRLVAGHAARVIVPSRFLRDVVHGWGVPVERIQVVYNSAPEPAPADVRAAGLGRGDRRVVDGRTVVVTAGRLLPHKRFDQVIRAVAAVRPERPDVHLVVAGAGPCDGELRALARDLGVADAVTFAGRLPRAELALQLEAADVFVLLSDYEGFSHVLLEAMRAGLPVVASDVGGNPELVQDGVSGRLVHVDRPEEVRAALAEICRDAVLRRRLADGARAKAAELTWDVTVERTLGVLRSLVQDTRTERAASNTAR
jgi:glycosyltransferase involved in cell wall biosynthesis